MNLKNALLLLLLSPLVSLSSHAFMRAPLNLPTAKEDCGNRSNSLSSQMSEIQSMVHKAAWYQDRDNSMSDANDEVGDAMAVVLGPNGTATQSIQVCPGVYLATAHGALDSPVVARNNNRSVMPAGSLLKVIAYPMVRENLMRQRDSSQFISPRLRDPSLWDNNDEASDYVFIKVDSPVRPNSFVTPINITPAELIESRSSLEVVMSRGKSRYEGADTGRLTTEIVEGREQAVAAVSHENIGALAELYQKPQRVDAACSISKKAINGSPLASHNCPNEQGTSGSNYTSQINGRNYLLGLTTMGSSNNIESSEHSGGSTMLTSSSFCADYQTACGMPCPSYKDLKEEIKTVSL